MRSSEIAISSNLIIIENGNQHIPLVENARVRCHKLPKTLVSKIMDFLMVYKRNEVRNSHKKVGTFDIKLIKCFALQNSKENDIFVYDWLLLIDFIESG